MKLTRILSATVAAALAFTLTGCGMTMSYNPDSVDTSAREVPLPDGTSVTCIVSYSGSGTGLECDWGKHK